MRLNEIFGMNYDMFGWIAPGGKVILATPNQAASDETVFHGQVARELMGLKSYDAAFKAGYVRWLLEDGILEMENTALNPTDELVDTINKGVKNIEKITKEPKKYKHFKGANARSGEPLHIMSYQYQMKFQNGLRESYLRKDSLNDLIKSLRGYIQGS